MNSRECITKIIAREHAKQTGFLLGNPYPATKPILHAYFVTQTEEKLRLAEQAIKVDDILNKYTGSPN